MTTKYNDELDLGADFAFDTYLTEGDPSDAQRAALTAANGTVDATWLAANGIDPTDLSGASVDWLVGQQTPPGKYLIRLQSATGGVTIDAAIGRIRVRLSAAQTAVLRPFRTVAHYLRIAWPGGERERLVEGTLRINQEPVRE